MFMAPTFVQVAARLSGTNCGWVRRLEFGAASHLWNGAGALALWLEVVGRLVVAWRHLAATALPISHRPFYP